MAGQRSTSKKPLIIEALFRRRWNEVSKTLKDPLVSLADVQAAIRDFNATAEDGEHLSDANPANFLKDFIRLRQANALWPRVVLEAGYTAVQRTGGTYCFEFIPLAAGADPFPTVVAGIDVPLERTPIESLSLPMASRRLGRSDEPWLIQVAVRLRVLETHLALQSRRNFIQLDHLQNNVKLRGSEIDAVFLATEELFLGTREVIVCCEAKGLRESIGTAQMVRQIQQIFSVSEISQDAAIPVALKAVGPSQIHVVEFEAVTRDQAPALETLAIASQGVYQLRPAVPGIGE